MKRGRPESLRLAVNAPSENVNKQHTIVTAFQPRPLTTPLCRKNGLRAQKKGKEEGRVNFLVRRNSFYGIITDGKRGQWENRNGLVLTQRLQAVYFTRSA